MPGNTTAKHHIEADPLTGNDENQLSIPDEGVNGTKLHNVGTNTSPVSRCDSMVATASQKNGSK